MLEHFENPRNVGTLDKEAPDVSSALEKSGQCGLVVRTQLQFALDGRVVECRWKTLGCGALVGSMSWLSEWARSSADRAAGTADGVAHRTARAHGRPAALWRVRVDVVAERGRAGAREAGCEMRRRTLRQAGRWLDVWECMISSANNSMWSPGSKYPSQSGSSPKGRVLPSA